MLLVGYMEGIDSERGIAWRVADSLRLPTVLLLDAHGVVTAGWVGRLSERQRNQVLRALRLDPR